MNKNSMFKKALVLSACLMLMWVIFGAGTTLAWFTDTTETARNSFIVGKMDLNVEYKNDQMIDYEPVDAQTPVFNDAALYEPGYTQVVYLKIANNGTVDFDYKLSVDRYSYEDSINVYGRNLHLPAHLRFGVVFAESEPELERKTAQALTEPQRMDLLMLNQYAKKDTVTVKIGKARYAALIVYMPEEVGNEANHMKNYDPPRVELGLTVFAQQAGAPME